MGSSDTPDDNSAPNQFYAYLMVLAVCITTSALSETTKIGESHFNYPFITRYICMTTGIIVSIPLLFAKLCICNKTTILKSDKKKHFYLWAFAGSMCLTGAGMLYFKSFDGLSVPTATALGGTRAMLVLILSIFLVNEELTLWKICACIVSVLGILCYVYEADRDKSNNDANDTIWGCVLCLLANFMFAFCDTIARKVSEAYNNKIMGSFYYQIFQGLYQLPMYAWVWFWPHTPDTDNASNDWNNIWWALLPAVALTGNNASVFIGVTIKSPFYVNIGTLLGIPLTFVVDIFIHDYRPSVMPIFGAMLLIISFLMLEVIQPPKCVAFLNYVIVNGDKQDKQDEKDIQKKEDETDELMEPFLYNNISQSNLKSINQYPDTPRAELP